MDTKIEFTGMGKNQPENKQKILKNQYNGQILYFDHARIRHMERMTDLFYTLFKARP